MTARQSGRGLRLGSVASALVAALLTSACCIGPVAFALLGIGGASALVRFEPWRPYLTTATLALLATGIYFTYRRPKRSDACDCDRPRRGRLVLWISTVAICASVGYPYVASAIASRGGHVVAGAEAAMATIEIREDGMPVVHRQAAIGS